MARKSTSTQSLSPLNNLYVLTPIAVVEPERQRAVSIVSRERTEGSSEMHARRPAVS